MTRIAIGTTPIIVPVEFRVTGTLNSQADGTVTVTVGAAGEVLSVQPDGRFERRPAGSDGSYERGRVQGAFIVFCPDGQQVYAFPLVELPVA